jgi:hypothetical protein
MMNLSQHIHIHFCHLLYEPPLSAKVLSACGVRRPQSPGMSKCHPSAPPVSTLSTTEPRDRYTKSRNIASMYRPYIFEPHAILRVFDNFAACTQSIQSKHNDHGGAIVPTKKDESSESGPGQRQMKLTRICNQRQSAKLHVSHDSSVRQLKLQL